MLWHIGTSTTIKSIKARKSSGLFSDVLFSMCSDTCPAVKSDMCCDIWSDFGPDVCFPGPPNSKKQRDISQHKRQCRLGQIIFSGFCGGLNFKNSLTGQAEVFVRCSLVQYAANFPSTSFCYISANFRHTPANFRHIHAQFRNRLARQVLQVAARQGVTPLHPYCVLLHQVQVKIPKEHKK